MVTPHLVSWMTIQLEISIKLLMVFINYKRCLYHSSQFSVLLRHRLLYTLVPRLEGLVIPLSSNLPEKDSIWLGNRYWHLCIPTSSVSKATKLGECLPGTWAHPKVTTGIAGPDPKCCWKVFLPIRNRQLLVCTLKFFLEYIIVKDHTRIIFL